MERVFSEPAAGGAAGGGGQRRRARVNLASVGAISDAVLADAVRRYVRRAALALAGDAGVSDADVNPLRAFAPQTPYVTCAHAARDCVSRASVTLRWTSTACEAVASTACEAVASTACEAVASTACEAVASTACEAVASGACEAVASGARRGLVPAVPGAAARGELEGMARFLCALYRYQGEREAAGGPRPPMTAKTLRVSKEWGRHYALADYDPTAEYHPAAGRVTEFRTGTTVLRRGPGGGGAGGGGATYSATLVLVRELPPDQRRSRLRVRGAAKRKRAEAADPPADPPAAAGSEGDDQSDSEAPPAPKRQRRAEEGGARSPGGVRVTRRGVRASCREFWPAPAPQGGGEDAEDQANAMEVDSERALHEFPRGTKQRRAQELRRRLHSAAATGGEAGGAALTEQDRKHLSRLYLPLD